MPESQKELSVIIPVFNEQEEIDENLRTVEKKLDAMGITYEIIVVNDGSNDNTLEKAKAHASDRLEVLSYETNKGKGFAVRHGMMHARGQYKMFMDADLSTSLDAFDPFMARIREGKYDILIGNRKSNTLKGSARQPFYRRFLGQGFTHLSSIFVGGKIQDFTCGFKFFNTKACEIIFQRQKIDRWAFDTELLYIALLHDLRIGEVPVIWKHHKTSSVRPCLDIFTSLGGLIQMKKNARQGLYR